MSTCKKNWIKKSPVEGTDVGAAWRSGSPHSPSSGPAAFHACQPAVAAPVRGRRDLVQEHAARWHSEMSRESFPCLSACWKILVQDHAAFRDGQGKLPINMLIYGNLGSWKFYIKVCCFNKISENLDCKYFGFLFNGRHKIKFKNINVSLSV